ncbi:hypothetical protein BAUCODRAFT_437151 [Baudoinia panamericana UAMH 10762]|uniref:Uncharacterized protein n=1 Tax=Baudoinia panamericana (strain UAMH 10762) TaxID=717646 RepID=M2LRJ6_BAUPA|nr:uncharacterized protein BAUCODRAFT_437151 [Baudoinia panamericana UAMH 10762]EMC97067.1 hypothetical protein BAUCODRAFT_437151 [Baudoinia panamericana UAMH 10762]
MMLKQYMKIALAVRFLQAYQRNDEEEDPHLQVEHRFKDLFGLEIPPILDPSLIDPDVFQHVHLLHIHEEPRLHWRVWHCQHNSQSNHHREYHHHQRHKPPPRIRRKGRRGDVLEGPGDEAPEDNPPPCIRCKGRPGDVLEGPGGEAPEDLAKARAANTNMRTE